MFASFTRPLAPPRRRRSRSWLAGLACAILLAACSGGSGSSGFDITAENLAIDTALETNGCTVNDGLTICASGTEPQPIPTATFTATATMAAPQLTATVPEARTATPTGTPDRNTTTTATPTFHLTATPTWTPTSPPTWTPTSTPIPRPQVLTNVGDTDTVPCTATGPTAPCLFDFSFAPQGFPALTTYKVAYRTRNPDSDWHVVTPVDYAVTIAVDPGGQYQFAVLVFLGSDSIQVASVDALGQTPATLAYVTPVLTTEEL